MEGRTWIKEGKNAIKRTRLSCREFKDNKVWLQLFALAYNLVNLMRRLALPRAQKMSIRPEKAAPKT